MPTLANAMQIAVQSLSVQQEALNATTNNIANANTPGYSRETVNLTENPPITSDGISFGAGVALQSITSVRDAIIELRILDETQQQSSAQTQAGILQQVEALFSNESAGIGADLQTFFNSISSLSTDPANTALRQTVMTNAGNLVRDFNQTSTNLSDIKSSLESSISQSVSEINQLAGQIAKLNGEVAQQLRLGKDPGTLQDQLTQLTDQLAGMVNIKIIHTESGDNITLADGTSLVVGDANYALDATLGSTGLLQISSQGRDITSMISGGSLGGTLKARDVAIPQVQSELDELAYQLSTSFNAANHQGFDLTGNSGGDFFTPLTSTSGAALMLSLNSTDPASIAASSDGTSGDGLNLQNLVAVRDAATPPGISLTDGYARLVFAVGNLTALANNDESASSAALQKLQDQRGAVSNVSIDEETTNLIRYQRAYEAAAHVISVVDEMTLAVINMGASS